MKTLQKGIPTLSRQRMRSIILLSLLSLLTMLGATGASAQQVNDAEPPSGPLLASAPDFSQWVVTYTYLEDNAKGTPPPADLATRTRTVTTTKTREIVHEQFVDGRGSIFDEWHVGQTMYMKSSGSTLWGELEGSGSDPGSPHFEALSPTGFRNLDWITRDHYAGTVKYAGRSCLLFTQNPSRKPNLSDPGAQAGQIESMDNFALIDAESRLPVRVRVSGTTRLYQFKDAPSEKLALPPDLAEQLRKSDEARAALNQRMPRPY